MKMVDGSVCTDKTLTDGFKSDQLCIDLNYYSNNNKSNSFQNLAVNVSCVVCLQRVKILRSLSILLTIKLTLFLLSNNNLTAQILEVMPQDA